MPKFVIERQYFVPMYQHIVVEAETLEEACKKGIRDDIDWDTQEMDCDSARATPPSFTRTSSLLDIPTKFTKDE